MIMYSISFLIFKGRQKDTIKSREELNQYCARPELKRNEMTGKFPKASYTLDNYEKKGFM